MRREIWKGGKEISQEPRAAPDDEVVLRVLEP